MTQNKEKAKKLITIFCFFPEKSENRKTQKNRKNIFGFGFLKNASVFSVFGFGFGSVCEPWLC